ncbi:MAG: hypothetical protein K5739_12080 [Lachnospiraceae bacterium]|nr:hypothetical protein [Lachnospiraceae bacterium]
MMISPQSYVEEFRHEPFDKLIAERGRLYKELKALEKEAFDSEKKSDAWLKSPSVDVRYQMALEYMAALCEYISEKYRAEIVWGETLED